MPSHALIIGAGISGLLAAHHLRTAGWSVTVVESASQPGGRMWTQRSPGAAFDTGAQFFSVRDPAFAALVEEWRTAGLIEQWCSGFAAIDARATVNAPVAVEDGFPRYRIAGGMDRLALHLARGLRIRLGARVSAIDVDAHGIAAHLAHGSSNETIHADAVILTPPVPISLALLRAGQQSRPLKDSTTQLLERVRYAPCLCVTLDYPEVDAMAIPAPGAVRVLEGPISWLASQRAKGLRQRGEGVVVHAQAAWSQEHDSWSDEQLRSALSTHAGRLLSQWSTRAWMAPAEVVLTRWMTSLATTTIAPACVVADLGAPVLFAGDAFGDRPRVEGAALSGVAAAVALTTPIP